MSACLELLCHGGRCCGIKHIQGFHLYPTMTVPAYTNDSYPLNAGGQSEAGAEFFRGTAPAETMLQRLDRYLDFCKTKQIQGLIEVTLVANQRKMWGKLLKERGFKELKPFKNSNTGNQIWVYHKVNE